MKPNDPGGSPNPGNEPDSSPKNRRKPLPETLPRPTVWPAALAFGITFLAWGILTSWIFSAAGAVITIAGCAGWIAELQRDSAE